MFYFHQLSFDELQLLIKKKKGKDRRYFSFFFFLSMANFVLDQVCSFPEYNKYIYIKEKEKREGELFSPHWNYRNSVIYGISKRKE